MDVDQLRDSITGMFYGCIIGILTQFMTPSFDLEQANMQVNCVRCATPPGNGERGSTHNHKHNVAAATCLIKLNTKLLQVRRTQVELNEAKAALSQKVVDDEESNAGHP